VKARSIYIWHGALALDHRSDARQDLFLPNGVERRQLAYCVLQAEPADPLAGCELGADPVEFVVCHGHFLGVSG
jgi:hypothetical protein